MVTGGGHTHLEETLSVLGVPVMSKKKLHQFREGHWLLVERKAGKIYEGSRGGREKAGRREGFFP